MAGVFDIRKGAFDSSEASRLHEAYAIALQGLRASHEVDRTIINKLARSIVKVAQSEPDCLRDDGSIDPVRLAQRAILRMLQTSAPRHEAPVVVPPTVAPVPEKRLALAAPESVAKIMLRLFERTPFAKL
jgi:hypothetical protein